MLLDPRRVLTFREVARQRSFSKAATALALTQPAVSQQVASLEKALGVPLLVRGPGGPTPSEAGALLLAHADVVAERLSLAGTQLGELAGNDKRQLRLGAFPSALGTLVPEAIARLHALHDCARADVVESVGDEVVGAVRSGALHVALVAYDAASPARDLGGAQRDDLFEEPFVVALPPRHRLAGRKRIRLEELGDDTWTAPSRSGIIARALRAVGVEPDITYVTSDPMAIARIVAAGLAVAMVPRLLAGALPGVAIVNVRDAPRRRVYAVTPPHGRHPLVAPFVDSVREAAR